MPKLIARQQDYSIALAGSGNYINTNLARNLRTNATSFIIYAKPDLFSGVGLPTLLSQQNGTGTGRSILYFDEVTKFLTTALGGTAVSGTKRLRSNTYYCFIVIIDINTP